MTLPITTARIVLRRFTADDLPAILVFANHPSVVAVTADTFDLTNEGLQAYLARQAALEPFEMDQPFDLAIERKTDGTVIGLLTLVRQKHRQGAIGWALGVQHRGQGLATEAAAGLIAYAFHQLGLHRIWADTSSDNRASWRLMERLGMRREAHLREVEWRDGKWIDKLIYAILEAEWLAEG